MPAKAGYPLTLFVEDVAKNVDYFVHCLGFTEEERFVMPDGSLAHALVKLGRGKATQGVSLASIPLMLGTDYDFDEFGRNLKAHPLGNGVVLDFVVPDVDKFHARIKAKGALVDEPPSDQFWGERTVSVRTPDGYYLTFAKRIAGFKVPAEYGRFERPRRAKATKRKR